MSAPAVSLPIYLALLLLLTSCDDSAKSDATSEQAFACYHPVNSARLDLVFRLNLRQPVLVNLHGGERIAAGHRAGKVFEVYRRWSAGEDQLFDVVEFDLASLHLAHSYVHYVSEAEYADSYGRQDTDTDKFRHRHHNPEQLALVPEPAKPGNTVHVNWVQTRWDYCERISPSWYVPYALWSFVLGIMGAG